MDFSPNYNYSGEIYKDMRKVVKLAAPEINYNSSYKTYKFGTKKNRGMKKVQKKL